MNNREQRPSAGVITREPRKRWVTPNVQKMRAGDAENGLVNVTPDGALSMGS